MRLYIALRLGEMVEEQVLPVIDHLRSHSLEGGFTRRENLHLTLAFLGEQENLAQAKDAVAALEHVPFSFQLQGIGRFHQVEGDLYWMGVKPNLALETVWKDLNIKLKQQGFRLNRRLFKPHLTLGRRVTLEPGFDWRSYGNSLPFIEVPVNDISLMESRRVQGNLTYTVRYKKQLEEI